MFESPIYSPHLADHLVHDRISRLQRRTRRTRPTRRASEQGPPVQSTQATGQPIAHDDVVISLDGVTAAEPVRR